MHPLQVRVLGHGSPDAIQSLVLDKHSNRLFSAVRDAVRVWTLPRDMFVNGGDRSGDATGELAAVKVRSENMARGNGGGGKRWRGGDQERGQGRPDLFHQR